MIINNHTLYRAGTRFIDTEKEFGFTMPKNQTTINLMKREHRERLERKIEEILEEANPFFYGRLGEYKKSDYLYYYSKKCNAILIRSTDNGSLVTMYVPYSSPDITWSRIVKLMKKLEPDFVKFIEERNRIYRYQSQSIIKQEMKVLTKRIKLLCSKHTREAAKIICKYID